MIINNNIYYNHFFRKKGSFFVFSLVCKCAPEWVNEKSLKRTLDYRDRAGKAMVPVHLLFTVSVTALFNPIFSFFLHVKDCLYIKN